MFSDNEPLPPLTVRSWQLIRGQGSIRKRQRLKEAICKHLVVTSDEYYQIMNGKRPIEAGDIEYIKQLIDSIKQQR